MVLESSGFLPSSETGWNDLIVPESGSATFGVKLSQAPTANVTVNLVKTGLQGQEGQHGDANAATVSPTTLTFTSTNWSQAQTVTVTGVADDDGDHEHLMILPLVSSTDADYASADGTEGVFVTVSDDGGAVQVGVQPAIGREAGNGQASNVSVTVWLSRAATGTVSVTAATADGTGQVGIGLYVYIQGGNLRGGRDAQDGKCADSRRQRGRQRGVLLVHRCLPRRAQPSRRVTAGRGSRS